MLRSGYTFSDVESIMKQQYHFFCILIIMNVLYFLRVCSRKIGKFHNTILNFYSIVPNFVVIIDTYSISYKLKKIINRIFHSLCCFKYRSSFQQVNDLSLQDYISGMRHVEKRLRHFLMMKVYWNNVIFIFYF